MIEFTKEQLAAVVHDRATVIHDGGSFSLNVQDLAAFTLAQMERAENAEAERDRLKEELGEAEEAIRLLAWEHCADCGGTGVLWAGPPDDPQQVQCERCWSEGLVPPPSDPFPIAQRMAHPAVRRARERGGRG